VYNISFLFPPILPFCLIPLILLTFYFLYTLLLIFSVYPPILSHLPFLYTSVLFFQGIFIINSAPILLLMYSPN
jgi:hypothetical protein